MADIVVVGAGAAGISLAVHAADRGLSVTLLEKADRVGGALHWSGGQLSAAGTRRQAARGITDDTQAHYRDIERISRGTMRPDLTRTCVEQAVPTMEWLEDLGFEYDEDTPRIVYGHEPYLTPRTVHGPQQGRSVLAVLTPALDRALASGRVVLHLGCAAAELVERDGTVIGVRDSRGETHLGASVVLTTGGYGCCPELALELDGVPLVTSAAPTATGDGIRLARSAGAAIAGRNSLLPTFGGLPPEGDDIRVDWETRPQLVAPERAPDEIYVDRHGRRFVAEDEPSIDAKERALTEVEDMTFWQVFDARALAESGPFVYGWGPIELAAATGVRRGVHRAFTLAELAELAGIDPAGLERTVAGYNAGVASGTDELGRRHLSAAIEAAPFYAIENHGVTLISFAGVDVDAGLRVRREDGTPVPGLYAAGEIIGSAVYNGNSFCSGMSLTPALALGRWLGLTLVAGQGE
jgi:fumarate reductase flavoprotein subunit